MRNIQESLSIVEEEKIIIRDLENMIIVNKQKLKQRGQFTKKMIDFLDSIFSQQLSELGVEDRTEYVLEINKMIVKNLYKKTKKEKLTKVKEAVMKFNTDFDKRTRVGFPSCWDQQGNLLPWETYEALLVEEKIKIGSTHERTTVLKG